MSPEPGFLHLWRGGLAVVIQTRFSQPDHAGCARQLADLSPITLGRPARAVGMYADGGPEAWVSRRQGDCLSARLKVVADTHHRPYTGRGGSLQDRTQVRAEGSVLQVRVRINQRRASAGRHSSTLSPEPRVRPPNTRVNSP